MGIARAYPVNVDVQLTSGGGSESRYPAGAVVTVPRIMGHTTLGLTACPGGAMIPLVPQIQAAVQKRIKRYAKPRSKKKKGRGKRGSTLPRPRRR
jgi:hypothetical protein